MVSEDMSNRVAYEGVSAPTDSTGSRRNGESAVHGNVPPLILPNGMLLNVGHVYRGYGMRENKIINENWLSLNLASGSKSSSMPSGRYGQLYLHHFILMDAAPPFSVNAVGEEFCITTPSTSFFSKTKNKATGRFYESNPFFSSSTCETIQFVSGLALETNPQGKYDVVLSYGIMDCGGGIVRIR